MATKDTAWFWLWEELARRLGADEVAVLRAELARRAREDKRRKDIAAAPRQIAYYRKQLDAPTTTPAYRRRLEKAIAVREALLREAGQ